MFSQPMKVGLKTSNLPDDAIDDIFIEEELKKIISGQDGDEEKHEMIYQILLMLKGQYWNSRKKHVKKIVIHRNGNRNTPLSINMCSAKEQDN